LRDANHDRLSKIESFQNRVTGALVLLATVGVATMVKVWTG
jgi:hypothetical protein